MKNLSRKFKALFYSTSEKYFDDRYPESVVLSSKFLSRTTLDTSRKIDITQNIKRSVYCRYG